MPFTPRTEFAQALKAVASERGVDPEMILETIKAAIVAAYRRDAHELGKEEELEGYEFDVELDPISGEAKVFSWPEGKEKKKKDITPPGFGRIAAQTAKQVIHQKIREAEKESVLAEFSGRIGTLISGMILRFDGPEAWIDIGKAEALMPTSERVPNERLNANQRITFLLKEIIDGPRGKVIILSRSDPQFVVRLFTREVPEISSGAVEIKATAREAGVRSKIAVASNQTGVDPVGSCVGQKGVRVQAVTNELGGERVDIVPWNEKTEELIKAALAPAEGITVKLDKEGKKAIVKAPEEELPVAIGKDGQNARLASKLTGWEIEIESKTPPKAAKASVKVSKTTSDDEDKKKAPKSKKTKKIKKAKKTTKKKSATKSKGKKEVKPKENEKPEDAKTKKISQKEKTKETKSSESVDESEK